ncbi:Arm DNA-binding domain-containing protein [Jeotgalibacillus campisalis]|uniref:Integrase n=1 Tax=Jeotgalibacillus campisalis TaxID=220754 RepID=A0A0C2VFY1_9BACL|nr:Arm DNA-binding domain-containing protein [Jeotgalibacillus campisalis]KIL42908.1 integrase [Jeotgalibacillus campisalis]
MASIQKRGKVYQYTVSYMVDGKSAPIRKSGFRTKKEAQVAAAEIEQRLARGKNPTIDKILFCEYFEKWMEVHKSHISPVTKTLFKLPQNDTRPFWR